MRAAIEVGASFGARSLRPLSTGGYLNYATDDTAETVEDAYAAQTFARLRAAKRAWDLGNLFRHNHNIPPGA